MTLWVRVTDTCKFLHERELIKENLWIMMRSIADRSDREKGFFFFFDFFVLYWVLFCFGVNQKKKKTLKPFFEVFLAFSLLKTAWTLDFKVLLFLVPFFFAVNGCYCVFRSDSFLSLFLSNNWSFLFFGLYMRKRFTLSFFFLFLCIVIVNIVLGHRN